MNYKYYSLRFWPASVQNNISGFWLLLEKYDYVNTSELLKTWQIIFSVIINANHLSSSLVLDKL